MLRGAALIGKFRRKAVRDSDTPRPFRGWKSGPVLSERRYKVRLSRLPALSIVFTSLVAGRRVRRISVGGLP